LAAGVSGLRSVSDVTVAGGEGSSVISGIPTAELTRTIENYAMQMALQP
jgi:hypothetical protein